MLFFDNPRRKGGKRRTGKRVKSAGSRRRKARRRARSAVSVARHSTGGSMARKRTRRRARARVARRHVRRRRRRSHTTAVALQRRGRTVYRSNPRRRRHARRYRRNPGVSGGVVSILKSGVKDGAIILVSQVAARKAINFAQGVIPIHGIPGTAIVGLGVPVVLTLVARKVAPNYARLVAAAAFAEGMRDILAATPVGPFLGDVLNAGDQSAEYSAWPQLAAPQLAAYPGMGDTADVEYQ